jgi:hypothetical protein
MLRREHATAPADLVIWISIGGLAVLAGAGAAFALWRLLHNSPATDMAGAAIGVLALGLVLVGLGLRRPAARVFLLLMGLTLAVTFFTASPAFTAL